MTPTSRLPFALSLAVRVVPLLVFFTLVGLATWLTPIAAASAAERADEPHATATKADEHHADAAHAHHEPNAMHHVLDDKSGEWEFFTTFGKPWKIPGVDIFGYHFPTKFMILELIAAILIFAIYVPLAKQVYSGEPPRGVWMNCFESILTFIRDEVARPSIGEHDADRFTPFLWCMFLFILFNNLLGMFPFCGSPTASIYVTLGLAIVTFFAIHGSGTAKMGFGHYIFSFAPPMDLPFAMKLIIVPLIYVLEVIGILVRNVVLAVRLFANMFSGHMVLATILIFIYAAGKTGSELTWGGVTVASVFGMVALSLLELFVAFLQAFVFTFLAALFMGMAMHPSH